MKRIQIETMELENFKCHEHLSAFLPENRMQILGTAGTGKTSLLDAWCWVLFGKDSRGSTLTEVRPLDEDGKIRAPLAETKVTVGLRLSWDNAHIQKTRRIQLSRSLSKSLEGKWKTCFEIDGGMCRKSDFDQTVNSFISEDLFFLLSFPGFFPEKTSIREKTAILGSILGDGLQKEEHSYSCLRKAAGDCNLGKFCWDLEKISQSAEKRDLPARISEMEGTLRQMGVLDFKSMALRRDCLEKRRQKLQKDGDLLTLMTLNQEISQLDQSLGQETIVKSCSDRLLKLRSQQETVLRNQRIQRMVRKEADSWLMNRLSVLEQTEKFFLKGGLRLDLGPRGNAPGCRILKQGIPYENLSRREKAQAQLGILRFLSLFFEERYPVFLDDWEINLLPQGMTGQFIALCRDEKEEGLVVKPWQ